MLSFEHPTTLLYGGWYSMWVLSRRSVDPRYTELERVIVNSRTQVGLSCKEILKNLTPGIAEGRPLSFLGSAAWRVWMHEEKVQ